MGRLPPSLGTCSRIFDRFGAMIRYEVHRIARMGFDLPSGAGDVQSSDERFETASAREDHLGIANGCRNAIITARNRSWGKPNAAKL